VRLGLAAAGLYPGAHYPLAEHGVAGLPAVPDPATILKEPPSYLLLQLKVCVSSPLK